MRSRKFLAAGRVGPNGPPGQSSDSALEASVKVLVLARKTTKCATSWKKVTQENDYHRELILGSNPPLARKGTAISKRQAKFQTCHSCKQLPQARGCTVADTLPEIVQSPSVVVGARVELASWGAADVVTLTSFTVRPAIEDAVNVPVEMSFKPATVFKCSMVFAPNVEEDVISLAALLALPAGRVMTASTLRERVANDTNKSVLDTPELNVTDTSAAETSDSSSEMTSVISSCTFCFI